MKKFLFIIFVLTGQCFLESCCNIEDECFDIEFRSIANFDLGTNTESNELDTIQVNNYAIKIESNAISQICFMNGSLGTSLYAFDCDEPRYILQNKIKNISIKCSKNLNSNFVAGDELKSIFKPVELNLNCIEQNITENCLRDYSTFEGIDSLEDALNRLMSVNFYFEETKDSEIELLNLFALKIDEEIENNIYKFIVNIRFENDDIIELVTDEVILN